MTETFLSHFTPSLMSGDVLEQMLVQRQELAQELVDRIRESATTPVKHYTLLIGPRGIGKTHLISLIYHRIRQQENLRDRLFVAWLWEDNWSITSFLDLIISIFTALKQDYLDKYQEQLQQKVETLYSSPETAEQKAVELLKDFIGDRTLLLLVENLDQIFDGLGNSGQKQFLAFLQESNCCTMIATSPSLFDDVDNKKAPFYDFFRLHDLQDLTTEDAAQLLLNVATIQGDIELKDFIASPNGQARIKAVHHLAGGNPRVYVIFSQFLTRESLDQLVKPFMRMLDDLTPYYQSRMQFLSPQQRKIVEFLCERRHAVSVKEIAEHCFITQATASSQLKTLRNLGYATSEAIGRESYYELREVLMRFCLDVKKQRGEGTIKLFVDFLRIWYTREQLQQRLELGIADIRNEMGVDIAEQLLKIKPDKLPFELMKSLPSNAAMEIKYLRYALELGEQNDEDPRIAAYLQEYENYWEKKDYINALQTTEKLIEINGSVQDWYNRGIALGNLGRFEDAIASWDKAIEFQHEDSEAWYNRGIALGNLGRFEDAIASWDKAIEFQHEDSEAWYNRGIALQNLGRFEEAIASYDKAIEFKPDKHEAWNNRGNVLQNLGRFEEAIASYDKAIEFKPDLHEAWNNWGVALGNLGRFEDEIASYEKAIEIKPDYHEAWNNRGVALGNLGRFEDEIASYEKAIEIKPDDYYAWNNRGVALKNLGRNEEAIASWDKAIEIKPDEHDAWNRRGIILCDNLRQFEEAVASFDKAIEIKPDYHDAWYNRSVAMGNLGRFEEAIASYDKVIEFKPDKHEAWYNRGVVLFNLGRFEDAIASYDKAIEIKPDFYEAWFTRGIVLFKLGRFEEAIASYDKAIEIDPKNANAWLNQSILLRKLKRYEESSKSLYKVIELHPNYAWMRRWLGSTPEDIESFIESNSKIIASLDKVTEVSSSLFSFFKGIISRLSFKSWDESIAILNNSLENLKPGEEANTDEAKLIISKLFNSKQDREVWRSRLTTLVNIYEKHNVLPALGQGLVNNIPEIMSEMISDKAARVWLEVWQEQTDKFDDFKIPLRLLNAAVRYRETKGDRRALLELAIEERKLLQSILDLDQ